jgi:N-acetylmuramoyl-L-alanine amidase
MRDIKYIVLHCTATQPDARVESIQSYWKNNLKWKSPGYHYIIQADGVIRQLSSENNICNGVAGYNSISIHVSYIGGVDPKNVPKDTRTPEQLASMERLVKDLHARYPHAKIQGHRDFEGVHKACPSFEVSDWLKTFNIQ